MVGLHDDEDLCLVPDEDADYLMYLNICSRFEDPKMMVLEDDEYLFWLHIEDLV